MFYFLICGTDYDLLCDHFGFLVSRKPIHALTLNTIQAKNTQYLVFPEKNPFGAQKQKRFVLNQ